MQKHSTINRTHFCFYVGYGIRRENTNNIKQRLFMLFTLCRYAQSYAFISVIELPRIPAYHPKPNIKDGTKIATYLFHLLSSNFIMKPRNNISSNIPDFKAIIAEAIIINNVLPNEHSFTSSFAPVIKKPTITTAGSKTARPIPQFLILNVIPKSLSFKCRRFVVYSRKSTNVRTKQPSILKTMYNSLHGNVIKEKIKSNGRLPNKSPAKNSKKYTKS